MKQIKTICSGDKVIAEVIDGIGKITTSYNKSLNKEDNHMIAAEALSKMINYDLTLLSRKEPEQGFLFYENKMSDEDYILSLSI